MLHGSGGGYDQGLWAGKVFFGDGHKFTQFYDMAILIHPFRMMLVLHKG
ncbi:MAG: hypothetical protein ACOX7X_08000 [Methanosarcina flavescens]|nr:MULTISPECIES: hypothetical protein [Methanosarcina]